MLAEFISHIRSKNLLDVQYRYLIAISGGVDSICLAHLMRQAAIPFELAHCNFGLRANDSEEDQHFVEQMAEQWQVKVHTKKFDTKNYAATKGISTQMAARDLRYEWFAELLAHQGLKGTVVAHHEDDQLETILLNLARGTGIEGIYGMSEQREKLIRPLLPFSKQQLLDYAAREGLSWREDSSNALSDYKRNFIRNEVLPLWESHEPLIKGQLHASFDRIKDTGKAFFHLFTEWKVAHIHQSGRYQKLAKSDLEAVPGKASFLYYWLREYGFNTAAIENLVSVVSTDQQVGQQVFSQDFCVNVDREYIYLGARQEEFEEIIIEATEVAVNWENTAYDILQLEEVPALDTRPENAMLDAERLEFPLLVRSWQEGDRFRPLGMKKFKKISDFLIDLKVPVLLKNDVKVVCDARGELVWLPGFRIDDRVKISSLTKKVIYFKATNN